MSFFILKSLKGQSMFGNTYKGKRVLVTGNTGFKGSWLTMWLKELGAEVYGFSDIIPTQPSLYEILDLEKEVHQIWGDITFPEEIENAIHRVKPDFLIHLAAQTIVKVSYQDPYKTVLTNVLGTANILEALRKLDFPTVAVLITSDKCYENVEQEEGYKESDHLGGKDIYSASKGAAEVLIHGYYHSFFDKENPIVKVASTRAGNIIGGGDWANARLVPDCMRAWRTESEVIIRSPDAIRPWQFVLEPISGYLSLGAALSENPDLSGEAFNFGPSGEKEFTVYELLDHLRNHWSPEKKPKVSIQPQSAFHEAGILRLDCSKAFEQLGWKASLDQQTMCHYTSEWYRAYFSGDIDMSELTSKQISSYIDHARQKQLIWAE